MSIKNKKAFSLVEVLMASFVFSVVMVAVAGAFSSSIFGYRSVRNTQRDLEQAQFAMNQMAKTIRTSSVVVPSGVMTSTNSIVVFDYSQNKCIGYGKQADSPMQSASISVTNLADCSASVLPAYANIADNINSLQFSVTPSVSPTPGPAVVGKVTISMEVSSGSDVARLQTTVSLRDYSESGL